ncbi:MAG: tRNA 2-selenouridine(34) synthase MnmH [Candidatus Delongbacteria bacterium]|nr:tRNA 2-selenouridine(34) synthase MnmH [Candidatus Delongbacteria bacterium]
MYIKRKDRSELVKFIQSKEKEINKFPDSFNEYFNENNIETISIDKWIDLYQNNNNIITIDLRSESEYAEDKLPSSANFPILDDIERDEVGFLYKQFSAKAALFLAVRYADRKEEQIKSFVDFYRDKIIYLYCWRGGGRSSAGYLYLERFGAKVIKIEGGYKAYRNKVHNQLYTDDNTRLKNGLLILTGLTGCGKTEIIEKMSNDLPVLDIEKAAGHASSLFGHIRYDIKNAIIPKSQANFENNLFTEIISKPNSQNYPFLSEGESKRISKFNIPGIFYDKMILSPTIKINSPIDKRVERIKIEYFSKGGSEAVYNTVENSAFFKKLLGSKKVSELLELLRSNRDDEFIEWILTEYYDHRYAGKYKNIIAEIDNINILDTIEEITSIMKNLTN